jgi:hypothetical protein
MFASDGAATGTTTGNLSLPHRLGLVVKFSTPLPFAAQKKTGALVGGNVTSRFLEPQLPGDATRNAVLLSLVWTHTKTGPGTIVTAVLLPVHWDGLLAKLINPLLFSAHAKFICTGVVDADASASGVTAAPAAVISKESALKQAQRRKAPTTPPQLACPWP